MIHNECSASGDMELDKIKGAWVITYWPDDEASGYVALRLKFSHTCCMDPDDVIAEVKMDSAAHFIEVGHFMVAPYDIVNKTIGVYDDVPPAWMRAFTSMLVRWGAITDQIHFGCSVQDRYGGEPGDSRDYFELNASDGEE